MPLETMTPAGRVRAYYKQAWGIGSMRGIGAYPHVSKVLNLRGLGWTGRRRGRRGAAGLGFIELSGITMVGIATGAVATYLWMRPPSRFRRSAA